MKRDSNARRQSETAGKDGAQNRAGNRASIEAKKPADKDKAKDPNATITIGHYILGKYSFSACYGLCLVSATVVNRYLRILTRRWIIKTTF